MEWTKAKEICVMIILTVLCIACFPANPLVLSGVLDTVFYLPSFILGWIVWVAGMALVMAPIIMFPRRGGVARGKSFVHTTKLVDSGIYSVVRHPQYLGGILALFVATLLFYPHWLFVVLGVPGILILYFSTILEERNLVRHFGDDYVAYMKRVPRMNIILGIFRQWQRSKVS
jgi:protein-S-isoprenylcysteine O-methyltransferase Ste14